MNITHLILYLLLIIIAVTGEHFTFGRLWARSEFARRAMGHATVLGLALIFVPLGLVQLETWAVIALASLAAGGTLGAIRVTEEEQRKRRYLEMVRDEVLNGTHDDETSG